MKNINVEYTFKLVRIICYLICLGFFLVWLTNAVQNYAAMPTTTNVAIKYGDDNMKNATFPSITFCKRPYVDEFHWSGRKVFLWKKLEPCINKSSISEPYFLSYLEECLQSGTQQTVAELVKKVSYHMEDEIGYVYAEPEGNLSSKIENSFKKYMDKIVVSSYHYNYGNCFTVDISSISENKGMFPMDIENEKFTLYLNKIEEVIEIESKVSKIIITKGKMLKTSALKRSL